MRTFVCDKCGKEEKFRVVDDSWKARWRIVAWKVHLNEAIYLCEGCNFLVPEKLNKNGKKN